MTMAQQIHLSLPLLFGALLDNVFYYSETLSHIVILASFTVLLNRGLKIALILCGSVLLLAMLLTKAPYLRRIRSSYTFWIVVLLIIAPLLYFNPLLTMYYFFISFAVVWDLTQRSLRPKLFKMKAARWFLSLGTLTAISAAVVKWLK